MALPTVPVRPSEFRALIPDNDDICDDLLKLIQLVILTWKLVKFLFKQDGSFTPEFEMLICSITCPETPTTTT